MKKVVLSIATCVALSTAGFSQLFVTGSVGLTSSGGTTKSTIGSISNEAKSPSTFGFEFSPKVGYYLNDKFAVGLGLGFGTESITKYSYSGTTETESSESKSRWALSPFARYNAVKVGKLGLLAEGYMGIFGGSSESKSGTITNEGPSIFGFGLGVKPVIEFELNEHWALESELNFLNLGFSTVSSTKKETNSETTSSENGFNFGVNKGQTITSLNIGITYKF